MPTLTHEGLLDLLQDCPAVVLRLLEGRIQDLPNFAQIKPGKIELSKRKLSTWYADLVLLLYEEGSVVPSLVLIVEVQRKIDPRKHRSWPYYLAGAHAHYGCRVELVVLATAVRVARWAAKPIPLGRGYILPTAIGPDDIPAIIDPQKAMQEPELAVLGAIAHGQDKAEIAVPAVLAAFEGLARLDDRTGLVYADYILSALSKSVRSALEDKMRTEGHEYKSEFARRYFSRGKAEGQAEGKAEGQAQGKAEFVLELLETKFGSLGSGIVRRVKAGSVEALDRWFKRALSASSLDDVFSD